MLFKPEKRLHFENSLMKIGEFLICKLRPKKKVSSDQAGVKNISGEVSNYFTFQN